MTTRRGFLGAILAAAAAPVIIKAESLMPVRKIIVPPDPYEALARAKVINLQSSMLRVGDLFTISGIAGLDGMLRQFEVAGVATGGVVAVRPAMVL